MRAIDVSQPGILRGVRGGITRQTWIDAARKDLVEGGIGNIKVARLASKVRVKRPGFYRHFAGIRELKEALLTDFGARNYDAMSEFRAHLADYSGLKTIGNLLAMASNGYGFPPLELTVRVWANKSTRGRKVMHQIDEAWIALIDQALAAHQCDDRRRSGLSRIIYAIAIGIREVNGEIDKDTVDALCAEVFKA